MAKKLSNIRGIVYLTLLIEILFIGLIYFIEQKIPWVAIIILFINIAILFYIYFNYSEDSKNRALSISDVVASEVGEGLIIGNVGILSYDADYVITWMSEFFEERGINRISKKLLSWIPEVNELFQGEVEKVFIELNGVHYEISRKEDNRVLFFKDVTQIEELQNKYNEEQLVFGIIHLDNYDETTQYLEEHEVSKINSTIRQPLFDWCRNNDVMIKRLKSDRFLIILNEKIFAHIANERFSILKSTRLNSVELDVAITLSMAFARGSNNLLELDEMATSLLGLAQSRGGDQVAYRKKGEDVKYFGGSSEAMEKRSRVRVRIMANALKGLILKSSNVIIVGHKEMDFDCLGAALAMSRISQAYEKPTSIIFKTGGVEEKLNNAYCLIKNELNARHRLITESEAINQLQEDTLVIMVDHHKTEVSNGSHVLEQAKSIAIIDHHRRGADLKVTPTFIYVEAAASSTCELISEFVPYLTSDIEIDDKEANVMLAGVTIDTNRFRVRTGARTFDALSAIRKWGADPLIVDEYLKDNYLDFEIKNNVLKYCQRLDHGIVVAAVEDQKLSRSMMSQVADMILSVKEVEASFVIAHTVESQVAISARSSGELNVQVIMEKMQGGGHRTAAAVQRENQSIDELKEELMNTIQEYIKEENSDESNIA